MNKVVFIYGPTAVGKSKMAIALAQKYNGEIISCDSVQVFKGFDIGSAKVTKQEMEGITHHNIDIVRPNDDFSAGDYAIRTKTLITEINARGKLPIIVGGTGLYIDALLGGYNFGSADKNEGFRAQIEGEIDKYGTDYVYKKLKSLNPELAQTVDSSNPRRLVRAMEIATFGEGKKNSKIDFDYKLFALTLPRQMLYARINSRVEDMLKSGLVDEVKSLLDQGVSVSSQGMRAIGYKEVLSYLSGEIDKPQMTNLIKQHSRNYAKRQLTFMRGLGRKYNCKQIDAQNFADAFETISKEIESWKN